METFYKPSVPKGSHLFVSGIVQNTHKLRAMLITIA